MNRSSKHDVLQKVLFSDKVLYIEKDWSIDSIDEIKDIVYGPAYKDFTPRTLKGLKKDNIEPALDFLAKRLSDYLHDGNIETAEEFDQWHKETCDAFMREFNELSGKNVKPIKFGKAQKIVNMSFKYLFCLNDSQNYKAKFTHCHMPLDSYILDWFIEKVLPVYNDGKEEADTVLAGKIREISWSNLEFGSKSTPYSYVWLQTEIQKYLQTASHPYIDEDGNKLSPFISEFYIWAEQQWKLACKPLLNSKNSSKINVLELQYPGYTDPDMCKYRDQLLEIVQNLEKFR